jgi:peptidyl-prolyl cis-trans isomerase D
MNLFRKLAGNIFFKIILAFVALTFVLFGVSGFILGSPNSWVAKVGSTTIGYSNFNKALKSDREMILASNKSEEAMKYIDSDQFKSDVLGRIVNKVMVEKLHDEYGVEASKKLILESVAQNPSFKKDGKFSHELFETFLKKNGINEEKYVNAISSEVVATAIIQTMSMVSPLNVKEVVATENFKKEKRFADVITISIKDIKSAPQPTDEEVANFFAENQKNYTAPEMRKVSYLTFSKKDFANNLNLTEAEILAEYEKNKEQLKKPESRSFYHILFDKEEAAKAFISSLGNDKAKLQDEFLSFAKDKQKKDKKAITINVTKKDLIPELAAATFSLKVGEHSNVLKSPLGFHVFLLVNIKEAAPTPFAEAKEVIKKELLQGREEKVLQAKTVEIDDVILSSNSLEKTAKTFNLKVSNSIEIAQNSTGAEIKEIAALDNFSQNAFTLKKDQISKIFYSPNSGLFYAIKIEEIKSAHNYELKEVKEKVIADLLKSNRLKMVQDLAASVATEVRATPDNIAQIAAKHNLRLEKNREFPRVYYVDYQGQKIPYQNKFLDELFALKLNEATSVTPAGEQEFVIGVLRSIKTIFASAAEIETAKKTEVESFRNEVLQEFNTYLLKKHPVKVNEKLLGKKE